MLGGTESIFHPHMQTVDKYLRTKYIVQVRHVEAIFCMGKFLPLSSGSPLHLVFLAFDLALAQKFSLSKFLKYCARWKNLETSLEDPHLLTSNDHPLTTQLTSLLGRVTCTNVSKLLINIIMLDFV